MNYFSFNVYDVFLDGCWDKVGSGVISGGGDPSQLLIDSSLDSIGQSLFWDQESLFRLVPAMYKQTVVPHLVRGWTENRIYILQLLSFWVAGSSFPLFFFPFFFFWLLIIARKEDLNIHLRFTKGKKVFWINII